MFGCLVWVTGESGVVSLVVQGMRFKGCAQKEARDHQHPEHPDDISRFSEPKKSSAHHTDRTSRTHFHKPTQYKYIVKVEQNLKLLVHMRLLVHFCTSYVRSPWMAGSWSASHFAVACVFRYPHWVKTTLNPNPKPYPHIMSNLLSLGLNQNALAGSLPGWVEAAMITKHLFAQPCFGQLRSMLGSNLLSLGDVLAGKSFKCSCEAAL
eukprot:5968718-Amphidinium_carterae.1